jgi:hypothetical protein
MGLLYHWRKENYEVDMLNVTVEDFNLVQNSKRWEEAEHGEWVWAFSRANNGSYVLVASFQVDFVKTTNSDYGRYMATPIAGTVVLYDPHEGEDIEPIIRQLPISLKNSALGRNFQGPAAVKRIGPEDEANLIDFSKRQKTLSHEVRPVCWMLLAHGEARLYSGNTGYEDEMASVYRYDSFVANHKQLAVGNTVVLASPKGAEGFARIQRIESSLGEKDLFRCPKCSSTQVKRRKQKKPLYRCGHKGCGHEFDRDSGISERVSCTKFSAFFEGTYTPASGEIPMPTLRSACPRYTGQLSIQRIDLESIRSTMEEQSPEALQLLEHAERGSQDGHYTPQLKQSASEVNDEGYFEPANLEDERKRKWREIVQRRGQPEFRKQLITAYNGRCAITGCDAASALEAAHITPYMGPESNCVRNGLLLRADIHTLFDLYLIGIDPETSQLVLAEELGETCYVELQGQKLAVPGDQASLPSKEALQYRWDGFHSKRQLVGK